MTRTAASVTGSERVLLPQHEALIVASGIAPEVAQARGYRSVITKAELKRLGFGDNQCRVPALLIPVWGVNGEIVSYQTRPDDPRIVNGKPVKYETPRGTHMVLDVPPMAREWLKDPKLPLFITEGIRKADAAVSKELCCIALLGVWNFRGTNEYGGAVALADWESIPLKGQEGPRQVYLVFDSDAITKPQVHAALARLKAFLESRGATVFLIYLPPGEGGVKIGLDDYLAAGHAVQDLLALARTELHPSPEEPDSQPDHPYRSTPTGLLWLKPTHDGVAPVPLTNFAARIVSQIVEDDGTETNRAFELEGRVNGRVARFPVTAAQLSATNWPLEHLGTDAVVYAGFNIREHVRTAIQLLSGNAPQRRVYAHTGWREIEGAWVYLHGGGAIGAKGPVEGVEVHLLPALAAMELPEPPAGADLITAVRASLRLLELAPDRVTFPIYAAIPRAAMHTADFSLHLAGPTGEGKTAIAALHQQHWGARFSARNLAGSWSSTANASEALAFAAKDAILVIDDFATAGTQSDVARMHREADRLMRAQGNRAGRQRMRADTTVRPPKPPRGLILSTGEEVPRGQSLRARMMVLELSPNMLNWDRLTLCQDDAAHGLYASAMAAFIQWLAGRYSEIRARLDAEIVELRQAASRSGQHKRTPDIVANLAVGLRCFLTFAQDVGALTRDEANELWARGWRALGEAAAQQAAHQAAEEPTRRFLELLRAAIASGKAHVAAPDGGPPTAPEAWGWRDARQGDVQPFGARVGWVDGDDVYLEPQASYGVAQSVAREGGDMLGVMQVTLHKRLRDRHLLASTDRKRDRLTVRRTLENARREVLHLSTCTLMPQEPSRPSQSSQPGSDDEEDGPTSGTVPVPPRTKPSQETSPEPAQAEREDASPEAPMGQLGRLGRFPGPKMPEVAERGSGGATAVAPEWPCSACGRGRFWRDEYWVWKCWTCHPPADQRAVVEEIDVGKRAAAVASRAEERSGSDVAAPVVEQGAEEVAAL